LGHGANSTRAGTLRFPHRRTPASPFSDPWRTARTIQRASERHYARVSPGRPPRRGAPIRRPAKIPIVLFSYFNPLLQYGLDTSPIRRAAGVDGVLVTDMIPEEERTTAALWSNTASIPYSSSRREHRHPRRAHSLLLPRFVYIVSRTGVTGARDSLSDSILRLWRGFAARAGSRQWSDSECRARSRCVLSGRSPTGGVGSAIVSEIERNSASSELVPRVGAFCRRSYRKRPRVISHMSDFRRVAIVGVGLIGGSMGLHSRERVRSSYPRRGSPGARLELARQMGALTTTRLHRGCLADRTWCVGDSS